MMDHISALPVQRPSMMMVILAAVAISTLCFSEVVDAAATVVPIDDGTGVVNDIIDRDLLSVQRLRTTSRISIDTFASHQYDDERNSLQLQRRQKQHRRELNEPATCACWDVSDLNAITSENQAAINSCIAEGGSLYIRGLEQEMTYIAGDSVCLDPLSGFITIDEQESEVCKEQILQRCLEIGTAVFSPTIQPTETMEPTTDNDGTPTVSPTLHPTTSENSTATPICPCWDESDLGVVTADNQLEGTSDIVSCTPYLNGNTIVIAAEEAEVGVAATTLMYFASSSEECVSSGTGQQNVLTDEEVEVCKSQITNRCLELGTPVFPPTGLPTGAPTVSPTTTATPTVAQDVTPAPVAAPTSKTKSDPADCPCWDVTELLRVTPGNQLSDDTTTYGFSSCTVYRDDYLVIAADPVTVNVPIYAVAGSTECIASEGRQYELTPEESAVCQSQIEERCIDIETPIFGPTAQPTTSAAPTTTMVPTNEPSAQPAEFTGVTGGGDGVDDIEECLDDPVVYFQLWDVDKNDTVGSLVDDSVEDSMTIDLCDYISNKKTGKESGLSIQAIVPDGCIDLVEQFRFKVNEFRNKKDGGNKIHRFVDQKYPYFINGDGGGNKPEQNDKKYTIKAAPFLRKPGAYILFYKVLIPKRTIGGVDHYDDTRDFNINVVKNNC